MSAKKTMKKIATKKSKKVEESEVKEDNRTVLKDYLGVSLLSSNYQFLSEIERIIGHAISPGSDENDEELESFFYTEDGLIVRIDICHEKLPILPPSIQYLTGLKTLIIEYCGLTRLPEDIGKLQSLIELSLGSNQLSSLVESIGQLKSLIELNISNNKLLKLPNSIGNLNSLQQLWVGNNQISELPESFSKLSSLRFGDFRGNNLSPPTESTKRRINDIKIHGGGILL